MPWTISGEIVSCCHKVVIKVEICDFVHIVSMIDKKL